MQYVHQSPDMGFNGFNQFNLSITVSTPELHFLLFLPPSPMPILKVLKEKVMLFAGPLWRDA